ncbi:hypothetical protein B0H15DRAFT_957648 [Mycena belliarum]|uniref:Uncharacterized protein n=1 Tax=Mycena belliarum TaxID=1033014 RepID=A0AAD6XE55_9AGAR|nr:hypothetical protein B0H15DRAFT_957648 [Mycena belliae]
MRSKRDFSPRTALERATSCVPVNPHRQDAPVKCALVIASLSRARLQKQSTSHITPLGHIHLSHATSPLNLMKMNDSTTHARPQYPLLAAPPRRGLPPIMLRLHALLLAFTICSFPHSLLPWRRRLTRRSPDWYAMRSIRPHHPPRRRAATPQTVLPRPALVAARHPMKLEGVLFALAGSRVDISTVFRYGSHPLPPPPSPSTSPPCSAVRDDSPSPGFASPRVCTGVPRASGEQDLHSVASCQSACRVVGPSSTAPPGSTVSSRVARTARGESLRPSFLDSSTRTSDHLRSDRCSSRLYCSLVVTVPPVVPESAHILRVLVLVSSKLFCSSARRHPRSSRVLVPASASSH